MEYSDYTKEQLIKLIAELEALNRELLLEQERDTHPEYAWTRNLGHWYWNMRANTVTCNPLRMTALGYNQKEMPEPVPYQFFTDKLHPADYKKTMDAMMDHIYGKTNGYEAEYRIQTKEGKYRWYYDRGRITQYDDKGDPFFFTGITLDITERKELQLEIEAVIADAVPNGPAAADNPKTLLEYLNAAQDNLGRLSLPLSLVLFYIDDFKKLSGVKGRLYANQILVDIDAVIKKSIRDTDWAGRYGGEDFMVVLSNANLITAANVADRIRQGIERNLFMDGLKLTVSGGVKQYDGEKLTDLIHMAYIQLYKSNSQGMNRIIYL